MNKLERLARLKRFGSRLELFVDKEKAIFLAKPSGLIGPSLIKADYELAKVFDQGIGRRWNYHVDTSKVLFLNPLNIYWIRKINRLNNLESFNVFSNSLLLTIFLKFGSIIIGPINIISNQELFLQGLEQTKNVKSRNGQRDKSL